ncbi:hypothetical protein J2128_000552 [Methanomicrobium sp. W14]|uniref:hypothetical protein n=1 Tax=Methanomicrobium sp. W14 TaxID=2817839 RepID=UPI001AE4C0BD|nr:hypothetical protein [Methanomicrobium sp. W14]MBP2132631.1 hypothetical protein [Methanomicrobium sp. W14]
MSEIMCVFELLNNISVISGVFGVIFGAIFGHWSAVNLWNKQIKHVQKNVASGFLIEFDFLESMINDFLNKIKEIEDVEVGPEDERNLKISYNILQLFKNEIYSDIGTWNILKEKVYDLPTDLCQKLDIFYSYILSAERTRKIFTEQPMIQYRERLIEQLTNAKGLIPELRVLLEKTAKRK